MLDSKQKNVFYEKDSLMIEIEHLDYQELNQERNVDKNQHTVFILLAKNDWGDIIHK